MAVPLSLTMLAAGLLTDESAEARPDDTAEPAAAPVPEPQESDPSSTG